MQKNTVALRIGRLLEVRSPAGYKVIADVEALFEEIRTALDTLPEQARYCAIVDHRHTCVMTPGASEFLAEHLQRLNRRMLRSAILVPLGSSLTAVQWTRVTHFSGSQLRRVFSDVRECNEWLGEVLNLEERQRLVRFLAEGEHNHAIGEIRARG